jgi:hypothetical protein
MTMLPRRVSQLVADSVEKSFWGGDRNFQGPLMRFAHDDMRDHITISLANLLSIGRAPVYRALEAD